MDHETEVIKEHMRETRTALTEKLEALEEKVVSTVKETTEAVEETVGSVKEAVEDTVNTVKDTVNETVDTVKETVQETFDLHRQMEQHPWLMLGGATLAGYLGGCLLGSTRGARTSANGWMPLDGHGGQPAERFRAPEPARAEPERTGPSLWDKVSDAFGPAVSKLESLAIGAAAGVIGKMILNAAPDALRGDLEGVINDLTTSLGGKPRPDLLHKEDDSASATQGART
jgi:ElaB/YqjD/DUF883 family membrane-anchored ribosome-binding protein